MPDIRPSVQVVDASVIAAGDPTRLVGSSSVARLGFALPSSPWDLQNRNWICVGTVSSSQDASAAIGALARGVGLVIAITLTGDSRRRFTDDLARVGSLETLQGTDGVGLHADHLALLDALARGSTMQDAARTAHLSIRTAHRRMGEVRERLHVASNAAAVVRWRALDTRGQSDTGPSDPTS